MYAIINKNSQRLVSLHASSKDLAESLVEYEMTKEEIIIRVDTLEELYEQIYS